ncbi:endoribonuclease Dcr-1 isoform X2 [Neodiprion fabricii]|uniref:endoribonuclease Dcr-1 isoform X2 n=1 Tax=Neodiprion fabricii TaxID=2872261 RepID=UPI001ED8E3B3|nr:endoribonuclease Dcr-1 isoform X2 [Neodiprion fabricii]
MAFPLNDQVHTKSFSPREYQVELLYAALESNIIVCLGKNSEQIFIVIKLIQELATNNRRSPSEGGKRSVYILRDTDRCLTKAVYIQQLTDLRVLICDSETWPEFDRKFAESQVIVATSHVCADLLNQNKIYPSQINLAIVDQCHKAVNDEKLKFVLQKFNVSNGPRLIGFAAPVFNLTRQPGRLEAEVELLEKTFHCRIETASDIVSVLRYSPKPKEYIVEYKCGEYEELNQTLENCAMHAMNFLCDHRYDPTEIYNDEFLEDIQKIPDPKQEPCSMIEDFLYVLQTFGAWCANHAALALLIQAEKLKVKTPYERHYLLFNVVVSLFIKIRAICESEFENLSEREKLYKFSTPCVHRLLHILKCYAPSSKKEFTIPDNKLSNGHSVSACKKEIDTGKDGLQQSKYIGNVKKLRTGIKRPPKSRYPRTQIDPDLLCGVIFVDKGFTAKILFYLLNDACKYDKDLQFLSPLYTIEKNPEGTSSAHDMEVQHRKQEEVLKSFRIHECNLLIATSILEEGIDIPKCNFVMRYDFPKSYQSYVQCKGRARATDALHVLFTLLSKCANKEPSEEEELLADKYGDLLPQYKPLSIEGSPSVTFNSAISLVNRYCAKLPSDTFTRLTPEWIIEPTIIDNKTMYVCSIRLPINSPVKYTVTSYPMPNSAMARRLAALQLCIDLHRANEIDDYLLPIGKENFKANPEDAEAPPLPDETKAEFSEARPGTTKRRQYYYKKTAEVLTDCRPVLMTKSFLYHISMVLTCPLPEEQNTRGRRIYPPEESAIGFGILTLKKIPKLCPFPIYTRSGEVHVKLELSKETVTLNADQIERVAAFLKYTFTNVLRLQKYLMLFDPNASENSYFIVPVKTVITENGPDVHVDWEFLERIYENRNAIPNEVSEGDRNQFKFDATKYHDAVIMPWYRNKDQPQYFYVAEICANLNPKSSFPGADYSTFEEYYLKKYNIQIQNLNQPLLDVDHTSARLNFLTPRYINRKGVALPTSSEETKKAKRENLEQKQILVAELCAIHPFPASLWRQAVCLPCILYRINALLLANQIRCQVAKMINLGQQHLDPDFEWLPLDFGWSLSEVLNKSKDSSKLIEMKSDAKTTKSVIPKLTDSMSVAEEIEKDISSKHDSSVDKDNEMEIGTWSNEMAINAVELNNENIFSPNLTVLQDTFSWNDIRYGSPACDSDLDAYDTDDTSSEAMGDFSDESDEGGGGLRIAFMGDNVAEAVEDENRIRKNEINKRILDLLELERSYDEDVWQCSNDIQNGLIQQHETAQNIETSRTKEEILTNGMFIRSDQEIVLKRRSSAVQNKTDLLPSEYYEYISQVSKRFTHEVINTQPLRQPIKKQSNNSQILEEADDSLFSFDYQPNLNGHPGPSPSLILQALTMSNANDGINLERLETIGDSFLKYSITTYLYCTYDNIHEGKLSHLRSKQVSNLNLYRLGRRKVLGESMIATKFEPHDNWLPPCYYVPREIEQALIESGVPSNLWNQADIPVLRAVNPNEISELVRETEHKLEIMRTELIRSSNDSATDFEKLRCFIPYNLITQHSIPDKSVADCVEALIGAYLIACGPRGAFLFMAWLGIHVLPFQKVSIISTNEPLDRPPGSSSYIKEINENGETCWTQIRYGNLDEPQCPLLRHVPDPEKELSLMLDGYSDLEESMGYKFREPSYLLQAFTHASYQPNKLTDCYQRLEFLGDAVLDYLITRHLYEDTRQHSPGALTDLRSALVNNTIFASLAVRCGFHKYFRHLSPGLNVVIDRFVRIQEENGHSISEEYYLIAEDECEEAEDVEVPKALGDVFESLAGAIYLDSGMSLDAVWRVYYKIMRSEIEQFSTNVPKSPIRELLELEPETAKFGKPEKLADGRRVRVTVDVFGKGSFKGIGRNYRIAKCTAAKCALKKLKKMQRHQREKL